MEIPRKIEYDFLVTLIGILVIIFPFYTGDIYKTYPLESAVIAYFGIILSFYGLSLTKYEYELSLELKELDSSKQKNEYLKYFNSEKLVTKKRKEIMLKEIKETIDQS